MNCFEYQNLLQRRLDGEFRVESDDLEQHLAQCANCKGFDAAAQRFEKALGLLVSHAPAPGMAKRTVKRIVDERRARVRFRRRLLSGAVAAGLLVTALVAYSRPQRGQSDPIRAHEQMVDREPPSRQLVGDSLQQSVRDAGSALVALVGRTADEAVEPGRVLWPSGLANTAVLDADSLPLDRSVRTLRDAGQGMAVGLEPLADSARRAVDMFLREVKSQK